MGAEQSRVVEQEPDAVADAHVGSDHPGQRLERRAVLRPCVHGRPGDVLDRLRDGGPLEVGPVGEVPVQRAPAHLCLGGDVGEAGLGCRRIDHGRS